MTAVGTALVPRAARQRAWLAMALTVTIAAGAMLTGRSVRHSQQTERLARLGRTDVALTTAASLSGRLPAGMALADPALVRAAVGLLAVEGSATHGGPGRRRAAVRVYGVDEAFWTFHGQAAVPLAGEDAAMGAALAAAIGARDGDTLELSLAAPSEVPRESVAGRPAPVMVPLPVRVARTLDAASLGTFSVAASTTSPPVVFVPLARLQRALSLAGRVNTVLVQQGDTIDGPPRLDAMERAWLAAAALPDHGVRIRRVPGDSVMALDGLGGVIGPGVTTRVLASLARLQRPGVAALASMATEIRVGARRIPYSTVAAIDVDAYLRLSVPMGPPAPEAPLSADGDPLVRGALEVRVGRGGVRVGRVQVTEAVPAVPLASPAAGTTAAPRAVVDEPPPTDGSIWLNEWAAADLGAVVGDTVHVEYLTWSDTDGFVPRRASFALAGVVPMMRIGGDRTLVPDWPGIVTAPQLSAWQVPFPVDPSRIRPQDEAYWTQWRTAPKAYVPLETGQRLWGTRAGPVSSIRFALRDADAVAAAVRAEMPRRVSVRAVRAEALAARGALVPPEAAALLAHLVPLLAAALLVWMVVSRMLAEQAREAALLAALGFTASQIRARARRELQRLMWPALAVGVVGGIGYAALLLMALDRWWPRAATVTPLSLHLDLVGLGGGGALALLVLMPTLAAALHATPPSSARALFTRRTGAHRQPTGARAARAALVALGMVAGLAVGATLGPVPASTPESGDRQWLRVDAAVPLMHDPSTEAGRDALGLAGGPDVWSQVRAIRVRWREGAPSVLGLPTDLHEGAGATGDVGTWSALERDLPDGASAAMVERRSGGRWGLGVGSRITLGDTDLTAEVVAIVDRGLLPSALMVSERTYRRLFPTDEGYRVWLLEVPAARVGAVTAALDEALGTAGVVVRPADVVRAEEGAAAADAQRAWRVLSLAGFLLGVVGALVRR